MGNCCKKSNESRRQTGRTALVYQSAVSLFDVRQLEGFAGLPLASANSGQASSPPVLPTSPPPADSSDSSVSHSSASLPPINSPMPALQRPKAVPRLKLQLIPQNPENPPAIKVETEEPMSKIREEGASLSISSSSIEINRAGSSSIQSKLECSGFGVSSDTKSLNIENSQTDSVSWPPKSGKKSAHSQTEALPASFLLTAEEPLLPVSSISLKLPLPRHLSEASTQTFRHTTRIKCTSSLQITSLNSQVHLNDYVILRPLSNRIPTKGNWYIASKNDLQFTVWEYTKSEFSPELVKSQITLLDRLSHRHILQLLEVIDASGEESGYFIYEGSEGFVMEEKVEREVCRKVFRGLAQAVDYLHREALVTHLGIGVEALLWSKGEVKLSDFTLAQSIKDTEDTYRRMEMGVETLAPEACNGVTKLFQTRPVDIWACGVTLYRMLYGAPPFPSTSLQTFMSQVRNSQ